jgi:hypothetical protein
MPSPLKNDDDAGKGAVEQDRPEQETNVNFAGQNPHRTENKLVKDNDTDYPEPGENVEHSGELMANDDRVQQNPDDQRKQPVNPEAELQDQDPGHRQKENQNQKKDDDLAA